MADTRLHLLLNFNRDAHTIDRTYTMQLYVLHFVIILSRRKKEKERKKKRRSERNGMMERKKWRVAENDRNNSFRGY